jgi:thiaminase/transcriptional activator TenA
MRLYAFLGQKLAAKLDPGTPYREWVETYARVDTEALASRLEALLDRYRGGPERLAWLYRRAMELELAFFQSAWEAA